MSERLSPLTELVKSRLREFWREPGTIFWVFGFPILMAVGLGLAFRSRPPEVPEVAVVVLEEANPASSFHLPKERVQELKGALLQSTDVHARELGRDEAFRALTRAQVDVIVELTESGVRYRFDPTQEKSPLAQHIVDDVLQKANGRVETLPSEEEVVSEPGARYIDFLLPGLIGLNLMGSSMWGVGYSFVVARKRKLLRRYAVTPMRRTHFLLSYFIARAIFLVLELSALVAFGVFVFDCEMQGSYLEFGLLGVIGAASFAGVSLLIGARIDNTESANGWMNLIQLPMWVLSGAFFSYERFPEFLHLPIELLPLTSLVNGLRAILNDGVSLAGLLPELGVLAVWGLVGFFTALKTFKWQ